MGTKWADDSTYLCFPEPLSQFVQYIFLRPSSFSYSSKSIRQKKTTEHLRTFIRLHSVDDCMCIRMHPCVRLLDPSTLYTLEQNSFSVNATSDFTSCHYKPLQPEVTGTSCMYPPIIREKKRVLKLVTRNTLIVHRMLYIARLIGKHITKPIQSCSEAVCHCVRAMYWPYTRTRILQNIYHDTIILTFQLIFPVDAGVLENIRELKSLLDANGLSLISDESKVETI